MQEIPLWTTRFMTDCLLYWKYFCYIIGKVNNGPFLWSNHGFKCFNIFFLLSSLPCHASEVGYSFILFIKIYIPPPTPFLTMFLSTPNVPMPSPITLNHSFFGLSRFHPSFWQSSIFLLKCLHFFLKIIASWEPKRCLKIQKPKERNYEKFRALTFLK